MFQVRNVKTGEIVNVYQVTQELTDDYELIMVCATIYSRETGWDYIMLDHEWEPTELPPVVEINDKKKQYHTPFGVGGGNINVGDVEDCGRGFIPADNKLSI